MTVAARWYAASAGDGRLARAAASTARERSCVESRALARVRLAGAWMTWVGGTTAGAGRSVARWGAAWAGADIAMVGATAAGATAFSAQEAGSAASIAHTVDFHDQASRTRATCLPVRRITTPLRGAPRCAVSDPPDMRRCRARYPPDCTAAARPNTMTPTG